jgi:DNA polymerase III delta prime subunit
MHAFIITGGTKEARNNVIANRTRTWNIHTVDQIELSQEEEHIKIASVREFQKRLQLAPFQSKYSVGIIRNAHRLTTEAQNALLKLIEEPPPHVYIVCEVASPSMLLPTIVSRCEIILCAHVSSTPETSETQETLLNILAASPGKKLAIIDAIATDRSAAKQWTEEAIATTRQIMVTTQKHTDYSRLIRRLLRAQKELEVNVNPRLVLDTVFLSK